MRSGRAGGPRPVNLGRPRLEGGDHLAERLVQILIGQLLEQGIAEREADLELDLALARTDVAKGPLVVEILERAIDIMNDEPVWPVLLHPRGELFAQGREANQHVGHHLALAVGAYPRGDDPRQEFAVAADISDQIEHLRGTPWQAPDFVNGCHVPDQLLAACLASSASRAARIWAKSSPA